MFGGAPEMAATLTFGAVTCAVAALKFNKDVNDYDNMLYPEDMNNDEGMTR